MKIEETYNIHKKINCVFPFFKSKRLCNRGIHNYILHKWTEINPIVSYEEDYKRNIVVAKVERYERINFINLKCLCCGKQIDLEE